MRFGTPLIPAMLARRYKRFLADVMLDIRRDDDGARPQSRGYDRPRTALFAGVAVRFRQSDADRFATPGNWSKPTCGSGPELVGVNTVQPNLLARRSARRGLIPELRDYSSIRREVKYGTNSRTDFVLEDPQRPRLLPGSQERASHAHATTCGISRQRHRARRQASRRPCHHGGEGGARRCCCSSFRLPSAERFAVAARHRPGLCGGLRLARAPKASRCSPGAARSMSRASRSWRRFRSRKTTVNARHRVLLALPTRMLTLRANGGWPPTSLAADTLPHDLC